MITRAEQCDAHGPPRSRQIPSRDEPVAAVVAGPAQHDDGADRPAAFDLARDRSAGIFHELGDGDSAGNGQAVGFLHPTQIEQGGREIQRAAAVCRRIDALAAIKVESPDDFRCRSCGNVRIVEFVTRPPSFVAQLAHEVIGANPSD